MKKYKKVLNCSHNAIKNILLFISDSYQSANNRLRLAKLLVHSCCHKKRTKRERVAVKVIKPKNTTFDVSLLKTTQMSLHVLNHFEMK